MNKTKHTPGPWEVADVRAKLCIADGRANRIADLPIQHPNFAQEAAANARLIAACPDAYALAMLVLETNDVPEGPVRRAARDFLRKVQPSDEGEKQ